MELIAPVLIVTAVVVAAVWATRLLLFLVKAAVFLAFVYAFLLWAKPEWVRDLPLTQKKAPQIVTSVNEWMKSQAPTHNQKTNK